MRTQPDHIDITTGSTPLRRIRALVSGLTALALMLAGVALAPVASAAPTTETTTFGYTGTTSTFTVPANVTQLTVTIAGAEGGRGGRDWPSDAWPGGYRGVVTGTISVTPGDVLTIGVGSGGSNGATRSGGSNNSATAAGSNPIAGYGGGPGGIAGSSGSSGNGGGGGAATVVQFGSTTLVAGGAGGGGGNGQWEPLRGRQAEASHTPRPDVVTGAGQQGYNVNSICSSNCDGGAGGGGGGGAQGGKQGGVEFGTGTFTEWLGYGGYPGSNSTAGITTLSSSYVYFSGNTGSGSVSISYTTGSPTAPSSVVGLPGDGQIPLSWNAPDSTGGAAISDYVVEYAVDSLTPAWQVFADGVSSGTTATVTGLTNGLQYVFRVSAVNSFGTGGASARSDAVTASGVPTAPVITAIAARDAGLSVTFDAADSPLDILRYQYRVDGGSWQTAASTTSPVLVSGLTNGTSTLIELRAVNAIGAGPASEAMAGTPIAAPGAPTITSVTPGLTAATVVLEPGFVGGAELLEYQYRLDGGDWVSTGSVAASLTVGDLDTGTAYDLQIRAVSTAGPGTATGTIAFVTAGIPDAVEIESIELADRGLRIDFTLGADGGDPISALEYQLDGGDWVTAPVTAPLVISGLDNGREYTVRMRAVNGAGAGHASDPVDATPATTPGAPTLLGDTISGSDGTLEASFVAPGDDGGADITSYEYSTDGGATWRSRDAGTTGSPVVIEFLSSDGTTPLENGTEYFVELRAVNSIGAGTASGVATGITRAVPNAPSITAVVGSSGTLQVTFAPASNGGSPIVRYEYRLDSGSWTDTGTLGTTFSVTGLTNGVAYAVELRAVNGEGEGAASVAVLGQPADLPGRPAITSVTPTDGTLTLGIGAVADGGNVVTGWEYSTDGGTTWRAAGAEPPLVIDALSADGTTDLVNGQGYLVSVRALNAQGAGPGSTPVLLAPRAVPARPVVTLTPMDGAVAVDYTVADDGGNPITRVDYRVGSGEWIDAGTLAESFWITGLGNGTAVSVQLRAVNAAGASEISVAGIATPRTVPGTPAGVAGDSDSGAIVASWSAPADTGGSPITAYTAAVYASAGSATPVATCSTAGTSCTISGLTNLTTYYLAVTATNAAGTGEPSSPRIAVTPAAKPSAPTITSISAANTYLQVAFTAGAAGSASITGYQYRLNGGAWLSAGGTSSPITVSSLENGTAYSVQLRAVSSVGAGAASTAVSATPYTLPDAPDAASIVADPVSGGATVTWAAPDANGSAITAYQVVAWTAATQGSQARVCNSTGSLTCSLTGLTNGTTYYLSIDATNAAGTSTRSTPRVAVVYTGAPGRVPNVAGVAGDATAELTWGAPATGASATSDYTVWYRAVGADSYTRFTESVSTTRSATVTGLTNGTPYEFVVYAVNANGTSIASAPSAAVTPTGVGLVPVFGTPVRAADGFTVEMMNFDPAFTYSAIATAEGTATVIEGTVVVTGLEPDTESTVTVTAERHGYATASGSSTARSLAAGVVPEFSVPIPGNRGFTFEIVNWDAAFDYVVVSTTGTASVVDGLVSVSGLDGGSAATVTVTVSRAGHTDASSDLVGTALAAAPLPTFGDAVRTADGFTVVVDLGSGVTHAFTVDVGAVVLDDGVLTVTGLAPGQSATITNAVSGAGFSDSGTTFTAAALAAGSTPVLSEPTATPDGFTFLIENFSGTATYELSAGVGTVSQSGAVVTVAGLAPAASATVIVTARVAGETDAAASLAGTSLAAGVVPAWGTPVATADGFTFDLSNYDADRGYVVTVAPAGTVAMTGATVTVTGLGVGEEAIVTIVSTKDGESDVSTDVVGRSIALGTEPEFGVPTAIQGGFTVAILNYDPAVAYFLTASNGAVVSRSGATITVSGLAALTGSTVTVEATRIGYTSTTASVAGVAAAAPPTPPAPKVSEAPDEPTEPVIDHLEPGGARGTVGGQPVTPTMETAEEGGVSLDFGGTTMSVTAMVDGKPAPTGPDGLVIVNRGGVVFVEVTGFAPGSDLETWIFSTATHISTVQVPADGIVGQSSLIPLDIELGSHTLVVTGTGASGEEVTMTLGLLVIDAAASVAEAAGVADGDSAVGVGVPETASREAEAPAFLGWLALVLLIPVGGFFIFLVRRRSRRDEESNPAS